MPLKLISPGQRHASPYYHVRGSYLGHRVERSTKTSKRAVALECLRAIELEIERGAYARKAGPTFAAAALSYMNHGGERRPLRKLLTHFGEIPLADIDQAAVDGAAVTLFADGTPATRNREVYTPISAVMKHAGIETTFRRPKGSRGRVVSAWLWPEQVGKIIQAATEIDREFAILLALLCYTGLRLSEALRITCDDLRLNEGYAQIGRTKNGEPRGVFLPSHLVAALANHPRGLEREGERLFRFSKSGYLYDLLTQAAAQAEVAMPERSAFHLFRHTFATWMRRYAGRDTKGLVATGAWKSEQSASRYAHVVPTEDARAAELLPPPARALSGQK